MVEEYNSSASNQGLSASEMRAFVGDLLSPIPSPSLSPPEFHNFDNAAVGLGFHHFTDPRLAAARLAQRLKKGGVLFIVDFLPHEHVHGHAAHTVVHMGFEEKDIRTWFEEAGVGAGFRYEVLGKGMVVMHDGREQKRSLFMARGTKM
jgi:SAM-dependent methyltransferase